jgi:hypothetical protein
MSAMNEPLTGFILLMLVETASHVWHWRRQHERSGDAFVFTPERLDEIAGWVADRSRSSFKRLRRELEVRLAGFAPRRVDGGRDQLLMEVETAAG